MRSSTWPPTLTYPLDATRDAVQLDQHLTPPDAAVGDTALAALSRHNQALGILLNRGLDHDEGLTELQRHARLDAIRHPWKFRGANRRERPSTCRACTKDRQDHPTP